RRFSPSARVSASRSIGESLRPRPSVRFIAVALQIHAVVVTDGSGPGLGRLRRPPTRPELQPLGQAAQLADSVAIDSKPGRRLGAVLAGQHHALLLKLERRL